MALLVPDVGERLMLQNITANTSPVNLVLKLYKNDVTPAEGDTATTYQEATFTGYANTTLTGSSWVIANAGGISNATYTQQTFTSSAAQATQQIYGYFVTSGPVGTLLWAERFTDGPYPITNLGDAVKVTPYIELA